MSRVVDHCNVKLASKSRRSVSECQRKDATRLPVLVLPIPPLPPRSSVPSCASSAPLHQQPSSSRRVAAHRATSAARARNTADASRLRHDPRPRPVPRPTRAQAGRFAPRARELRPLRRPQQGVKRPGLWGTCAVPDRAIQSSRSRHVPVRRIRPRGIGLRVPAPEAYSIAPSPAPELRRRIREHGRLRPRSACATPNRGGRRMRPRSAHPVVRRIGHDCPRPGDVDRRCGLRGVARARRAGSKALHT
ncbi:hypothetical protein B0H17DRAFT_718443 [Mycena rosella]|uniref:Uncharacterized protein n=1 Tax=Mycena rosella TaxID=1033263 RepID=A0AAD7D9N3_MYCRO|nr:hypothetical protein B0H17DRAFT_718443 [Mycena rosella]